MKRLRNGALALIILLMLAGCGHTHDWTEADCVTPKTCTICGETEGEALGHAWEDATCNTPKTCSRCGAVEGEPLPHDWQVSEVVAPKCDSSGYTWLKCSRCGVSKKDSIVEALGHDWVDATCTTPKTCAKCGRTNGSPRGHEATAEACENAWTCARCGEEFPALGHDWIDASCTEPKTCSRCGATEGDPLGHTPSDSVEENKKPATCTEDGSYDSVVYCSLCGAELSREPKTETALGHTVSSGKCDRCGAEIYEPITGHGDDVISGVDVGDGIYRVHITNKGSHNFAVWVYDSDDDKDLAVNTIGNYDGYYFLLGHSPYTFEIESRGDWSFTVEKIGVTDASSFSGSGDYVTDIFSSDRDIWHISHSGKHNFVVWLFTTNGRDLIVNEIGSYDGKKKISIPSGSNALWVVEADGDWTIEPAD